MRSRNKPFARYWLHARFLKVDGGKMSKSIGNLYTVDQLEEMGHPAAAVRFLLLRAHYRQVLNFTLEGLEQAAAAVRRLRLFAADMEERADGAEPGTPPDFVTESVKRFDASMDDDLNLSGALDGVFSLMTAANRSHVTGPDAASTLAALRRFDEVLGVLAPEQAAGGDDDAEIEQLIDERNAARANKDWATADRIRDTLTERGIEILDGKTGARWRRTGLAES